MGYLRQAGREDRSRGAAHDHRGPFLIPSLAWPSDKHLPQMPPLPRTYFGLAPLMYTSCKYHLLQTPPLPCIRGSLCLCPRIFNRSMFGSALCCSYRSLC